MKRLLWERFAEGVAPPAAGAAIAVGISGPPAAARIAQGWMRKAAHSSLSDSQQLLIV
jgi:hypothetical protein